MFKTGVIAVLAAGSLAACAASTFVPIDVRLAQARAQEAAAIRTQQPAGAPVQAAPARPQQVAAAAPGQRSRRVCRKITPTGSNYPKRVCSTPEEWAELDRMGQEGVDRIEDVRRNGGLTGEFETLTPR